MHFANVFQVPFDAWYAVSLKWQLLLSTDGNSHYVWRTFIYRCTLQMSFKFPLMHGMLLVSNGSSFCRPMATPTMYGERSYIDALCKCLSSSLWCMVYVNGSSFFPNLWFSCNMIIHEYSISHETLERKRWISPYN